MAKKAAEAEVKKIKVTLVKSTITCLKNQKANVEALGLHKVGSSNTFDDTPVVRGMIKKVSHLVKVEEI
ncbi:MAG: 50S ribosomal protein L30 [Clostridia bacterium]|nr:50S ribosomal protein L30 [Clostridia bacterium]